MRHVGLLMPTISPVVGSQIVNTCAYGSTGGDMVVNSNWTFVCDSNWEMHETHCVCQSR